MSADNQQEKKQCREKPAQKKKNKKPSNNICADWMNLKFEVSVCGCVHGEVNWVKQTWQPKAFIQRRDEKQLTKPKFNYRVLF